MILAFSKYHGAGNDFIIIDDRNAQLSGIFKANQKLIASMCHRHRGIGADGLILLLSEKEGDFRMVYYNADGNEGSFCGNGARCAVAFAHRNTIINQLKTRFTAIDGKHYAAIEWFDQNTYMVSLHMRPSAPPKKIAGNKYYVNTGSPHLVIFVEELSEIDVNKMGKSLRNSPKWSNAGVNVNFVKLTDMNHIAVRTYERGVERETLSCGTGVAAAAITAYVHHNECDEQNYYISTLGGRLEVSLTPPQHPGGKFNNIKLFGPAEFVFKGEYIADEFI